MQKQKRLIVIDNWTSFLAEILALFSDVEIAVFRFTEIDSINFSDTDGIVLSGGHGPCVAWSLSVCG